MFPMNTDSILEIFSVHWHHNERDAVSNHRRLNCLLNRLFRRRAKKASKLHVTGICEGTSPVAGEFPTQRASNEQNVYIWWHYHDDTTDDRHLTLPLIITVTS